MCVVVCKLKLNRDKHDLFHAEVVYNDYFQRTMFSVLTSMMFIIRIGIFSYDSSMVVV